jgi:peroxiredoxin
LDGINFFQLAWIGKRRIIKNGSGKMPKVAIDKPAPDFSLKNFQGQMISLSEYQGRNQVLLVFNRGFL